MSLPCLKLFRILRMMSNLFCMLKKKTSPICLLPSFSFSSPAAPYLHLSEILVDPQVCCFILIVCFLHCNTFAHVPLAWIVFLFTFDLYLENFSPTCMTYFLREAFLECVCLYVYLCDLYVNFLNAEQ